MTQSEIYDRILSGIINDWYYSEHSNMDTTVANIRELSEAYWDADYALVERGRDDELAPYLQEHYPQYYKELHDNRNEVNLHRICKLA